MYDCLHRCNLILPCAAHKHLVIVRLQLVCHLAAHVTYHQHVTV